jgi:hypothetical protein
MGEDWLPSKGMYSMNRTEMSRCRQSSTKSEHSLSFTPRITTQFTFTFKPRFSAWSIVSKTFSNPTKVTEVPKKNHATFSSGYQLEFEWVQSVQTDVDRI